MFSETGGIWLNDLAVTSAICSPSNLYTQWNPRIMNALNSAASVSLTGNNLTLRGSDDWSLVFVRM